MQQVDYYQRYSTYISCLPVVYMCNSELSSIVFVRVICGVGINKEV